MRIFGYIALVLLFVVGGAVFSSAMFFVNQGQRIVAKTFDADNVLHNYEWFRNQYNDVLAIDRKIANTAAAVTGTSDEAERTRLNQVVLGLQNQRESMVAQYNANAQKSNRNIFLNPPLGGEVLPERL
jgi:hypothetical protein